MLESVVKNCGSIVHVDIATREFMDFMKEQAKVTKLRITSISQYCSCKLCVY